MGRSHTRRRPRGRKDHPEARAAYLRHLEDVERISAQINQHLNKLVGQPFRVNDKDGVIKRVSEAIYEILTQRFADRIVQDHIDVQVTPNPLNATILDIKLLPKDEVGEMMLLLAEHPALARNL